MAKFTNYLLILMGILVLFYIFGVDTGGATSGLLDILLNVENVQSNSVIALIITAATSLAVGGVIVAITRGFNVGDLIPWTIVPLLLNIGYEFINVFVIIKDFSTIFALLIIAPLIVLWVLTVIEWAKGVTT